MLLILIPVLLIPLLIYMVVINFAPKKKRFEKILLNIFSVSGYFMGLAIFYMSHGSNLYFVIAVVVGIGFSFFIVYKSLNEKSDIATTTNNKTL